MGGCCPLAVGAKEVPVKENVVYFNLVVVVMVVVIVLMVVTLVVVVVVVVGDTQTDSIQCLNFAKK